MLPYFYIQNYNPAEDLIEIDESNSKHIVQVLRMQSGDSLHLTDGKGHLITGEITIADKRHCVVKKINQVFTPKKGREVSIAVSLLKNTSRFEWLLEKAIEIGVVQIIPLLCHRTEKEKFKTDRLQGICVSALLQSRQVWLPTLQEPTHFNTIDSWKSKSGSLFIAHCEPSAKKLISTIDKSVLDETMIAIGPEGDFTPDEIKLAEKNGFASVGLGDTRLRTETAAIVAITLLRLG